MTADQVFERFFRDLRQKGILKENEEPPKGLELAELIIKHYTIYPNEKNDALIPVNYCMLYQSAPKYMEKVIKFIFSAVC